VAFIGAKALQHGDVAIEHCRDDALTDPMTHDLGPVVN
jgi:hypothetical protein